MKRLSELELIKQAQKANPQWKNFDGVCYYNTPAKNGARVCPGEITHVLIAKAYDDGTCYVAVGDGWNIRLITNRIQISEAFNFGRKYLNTSLSEV